MGGSCTWYGLISRSRPQFEDDDEATEDPPQYPQGADDLNFELQQQQDKNRIYLGRSLLLSF